MPDSDGIQAIAGFGGLWLQVAAIIVLCVAALRYRHLYRRARDEHANHHDLIENLTEGIYRSTPEGKQLSANRALVRLNGFDSETEMLQSITDIAREWYVDPGRRDEFRAVLRRDGKVVNFISEIYRYKTRERIWISESARLVRDRKTGVPLFYEGSVKEITETVARLNLEERFRKLTTQVPGGLFQVIRHDDGTYSIPYVSSGFQRISSVREGDAFPEPAEFLTRIDADHRQHFSETLKLSASEMSPWECEFRSAVAVDGERKWLRVTAKPEAVGNEIIWHGYLADISVRKRYQMEIERLAFHDPLTDVANRRMYVDQMAATLERCARTSRRGALLFIDLDDFKKINDTMGHAAGDALLRQVATRLSICTAEGDLVARIGGDEFVVMLPDAGASEAAASRSAIVQAGKILTVLRQPFDLQGKRAHHTTASVGAVVFDGSLDVDDIMKKADIAMYEAKSDGRDRLALYSVGGCLPETAPEEGDLHQRAAAMRA